MARRMQWEKASQRERANEHRPNPDGPLTYWLTVYRYGGTCSECGEGPYDVLAYRHADQSSLCQLCWERAGVEPKESKRYKAQNKPLKKSKNPSRLDALRLPCSRCGAAAGEPCWGKQRIARRKRVHLERYQAAQLS